MLETTWELTGGVFHTGTVETRFIGSMVLEQAFDNRTGIFDIFGLW